MSEDVKQEESSTTEGVESTTEPKVEESTPSVDYKSEAEKYRKQAEEYRGALKRIQESKSRKEEPREQEEEESNDLLSLVDERLNRFQSQAAFEQELEKLTDNADERELVKLVYENDLKVKNASRDEIREALKKAQAIANLPRLESVLREKVTKEVKASVAQDRTMSEGAMTGGSGRQPPKAEEQLTPGQSKFMAFVDSVVKANQR